MVRFKISNGVDDDQWLLNNFNNNNDNKKEDQKQKKQSHKQQVYHRISRYNNFVKYSYYCTLRMVSSHHGKLIIKRILYILLGLMTIYVMILIFIMKYNIELYNHMKVRPLILSRFLDMNIDLIQPKYVGRRGGVKLHVEELGRLDLITHPIQIDGMHQMKDYHIFICGIVRDNAKELPNLLTYIENTGLLFSNYTVIIVENDSTDTTPQILDKFAERKPNQHKIIHQQYNLTKRPSIKFLANLRNVYLNEIFTNYYNGTTDYSNGIMMVVDLDMKYGWDMRGLYHTFYHIDQWDAVCSNGIYTPSGRMYDSFAFRNEQFPYNNKAPNYWFDIARDTQLIHLPELGLQSVYSCFGGMAFYKLQYIKQDCIYKSISHDCEHVAFHHCIRTKHNGRIMMNNALLVRYMHYGTHLCCQYSNFILFLYIKLTGSYDPRKEKKEIAETP